jgi:hypothetical protein
MLLQSSLVANRIILPALDHTSIPTIVNPSFHRPPTIIDDAAGDVTKAAGSTPHQQTPKHKQPKPFLIWYTYCIVEAKKNDFSQPLFE